MLLNYSNIKIAADLLLKRVWNGILSGKLQLNSGRIGYDHVHCVAATSDMLFNHWIVSEKDKSTSHLSPHLWLTECQTDMSLSTEQNGYLLFIPLIIVVFVIIMISNLQCVPQCTVL